MSIATTPLALARRVLAAPLARVLGLDPHLVALASRLTHPVHIAALIVVEALLGAWIRRGRFAPAFPPLPMDVVTASVDLLTGSVAAGAVLALSAFFAVLTAITGSFHDSGPRDAFFREATEPYLRWGINAWSFANAKVRHDPIYFDILRNPRLLRSPDHGLLLDLGCGQGFVLSCLATAREWARRGEWPREWPGAPEALMLYGIEHRDSIAGQARSALGGRATVVTGDIRKTALPTCAAALCLDVLHLIAFEDQEAIVRRVAAALDTGGLFLLREADKGAGWRFQMVRWGNLLTAITQLDPRRRFYFRSADEWAALLTRCGLTATARPMGEGTPFANVLVEGVKRFL